MLYQNRNRLYARVEENARSLSIQWCQTTEIYQFTLNAELKPILEEGNFLNITHELNFET